MRSSGIPATPGPSFLTAGAGYAVPNFKGCFIRMGSNCSGQSLKGIDLSGMPVLNMNFTNAFLGNANMRNANLTGTNFNNAYLGKADLRRSVVNGDVNTKASNYTYFQARSFYKADLSYSVLAKIEVVEGKFYGTKWTGTRLVDVSFPSSDFRTANFSRSRWIGRNDMRKTSLFKSKWYNSVGVIDGRVNFKGAKNCPKTLIRGATSWPFPNCK